jgi:hypothetical protein
MHQVKQLYLSSIINIMQLNRVLSTFSMEISSFFLACLCDIDVHPEKDLEIEELSFLFIKKQKIQGKA